MYTAKPLTYEYDALEPHISARTIAIHYNNHYLNYLNKLNSLLQEQGYNYRYSKEELVKHIDSFDLKVRGDILYNVGGVLNHELYFSNMSPKHNNIPVGKIKRKIEETYETYDNFKKEFTTSAKKLVGSGYTFLVVKNGELKIISMPNQETPYSYGFTPIMTIDLWEHAYYLDYQNNKDAYIKNFFEIVDFDIINFNYEKYFSE